jgi:hypothetical protein
VAVATRPSGSLRLFAARVICCEKESVEGLVDWVGKKSLIKRHKSRRRRSFSITASSSGTFHSNDAPTTLVLRPTRRYFGRRWQRWRRFQHCGTTSSNFSTTTPILFEDQDDDDEGNDTHQRTRSTSMMQFGGDHPILPPTTGTFSTRGGGGGGSSFSHLLLLARSDLAVFNRH